MDIVQKGANVNMTEVVRAEMPGVRIKYKPELTLKLLSMLAMIL